MSDDPNIVAQLADVTAKLAASEAKLGETAATVLAGVPAQLKGLIPTSLSASDQVTWFEGAKATGIFDKPIVAATDGGIKPAIKPLAADFMTLPLYARMAAGYSKKNRILERNDAYDYAMEKPEPDPT